MLTLAALTLIFIFCLALAIVILAWENRGLNQKLSGKEELISIASHEISAPLTQIKGTLSLIIKEPNLSPEGRNFSQRALGSVDHLIKLIENLLTVSRFELGKMEINRAPVSLEEICAEVTGQYGEAAKAENLKLEYKPPNLPLPRVNADGERLREVVGNFVSNALKYTHTGGIEVTCGRQNNLLIAKVSDTGPGVRKEDVSTLFNRFVRLPATKPGHKGAGLGLYISRLIVEAHGGKIWAESELGKGSSFYFSLPL